MRARPESPPVTERSMMTFMPALVFTAASSGRLSTKIDRGFTDLP